MNRKGFAISTLLYPAFVIIITIVILLLLVLVNSSYSISKLTYEISGDISDNNTMKSLKYNLSQALKESSSNRDTLYVASYGSISPKLLNNEVTNKWNGSFYTKTDGTDMAYIDNKKYCAYKLSGMSGIAVYNTGDCLTKIADQTGCDDIKNLVCASGSLGFNIQAVSAVPTQAPNVVGFDLAVNTTIEITGYRISAKEPTDKYQGMVWVIENINSTYTLTSEELDVPISYVMQYNNGTWENKEAYIYDRATSSWVTLYNKIDYVYKYSYTGKRQTFTAQFSGYYTVQLWGASGGNGGRGAYTQGDIYLNSGDKLYVYVGGTGGINATGSGGGWNGGGNAGGSGTSEGGGGATDVRVASTSAETTWNEAASLYSRIMVAAGGGGAENGSSVGGGGGLYGLPNNAGSVATQGRGTAFGAGCSYSGDGSGSGSGWWGGYCPSTDSVNGGGGSSYISGHAGVDSVDASGNHTGKAVSYTGLYFINTKMVDGNGYQWTNVVGNNSGMPTQDGTSTMTGNVGNGYAVISLSKIVTLTAEQKATELASVSKEWNYYYTGKYQRFDITTTGRYKVQLWGATGYSTNGGGGYVSGEITLNAGTTLYVYVGGQGVLGTSSGGGWNGGANAGGSGISGAGGGATDIRVSSTSALTIWNEAASLYSRIIVAGGAGGSESSSGGAAGGLIATGNNAGTTATQTSGCAFGYGCAYSGDGSSGGGGWWGGKAATADGVGGGGGSSYISGHAGCIGVSNTGTANVATYSTLSDSYSFTGYVFTNTIMTDGHGYAWTTS
jgi:hypothetical protein